MRAALLPTPGDPFVLDYFCRNAATWRSEVDELCVYVNGAALANEAAIAAMLDRLGARYFFNQQRVGHGDALVSLLRYTQADEVVLVEDDAYVRHPGSIAHGFLERAALGVVASPRGGMSPAVEQAALAKWGQVEGPDGSTGHGLWPCFLFATRAELLDVAEGFPSRSWAPGEMIPGLGYTPTQDVTTDTFTLAAFLLRERGRIVLSPQHKELFQKVLPPSDPPWFHAGGLSNATWHNGGSALGLRANLGGSNEGLDWAHRAWWWERCLNASGDLLPDLQVECRHQLERLVVYADIGPEVYDWGKVLPEWITWDDGTP